MVGEDARKNQGRRRRENRIVDNHYYTVRQLKIGRTEQMDALARAAGDLYSQVVLWFWRTVRHKDLWLKAKHLMRWLTSALLHAHSSDAVVQSFFAALASWRERRKSNPDAKAPHRRTRFYRVQWKPSAIRLKDGMLHLANGKVDHCGFVFHRDGVGAINIRQKYTGSGPVVGAMASPTGVRYHAHLSRSSRCEPRERIPAL